MNIAIEATPGIKGLGGISEYTRQLIKHLSVVDKSNAYAIASVSLFRNKTNEFPKLSHNFSEHMINLPARLIESSWYSFGRPSLDLWVGMQDVILFPRPLITASRARRVAVIHDLSWLILPRLADRSNVERFRRALTRTVREADHLIAISNATKQDLIKHFNLNHSDITVIHLGFDESLESKVSKSDEAIFRHKFKLGQSPYFLHVGTLEPRKNLTVLVEAFDHFKKKTGSLHKLVLVGRMGWLYQELLNKIEHSPYVDDLVLTGSVNDQERVCAYALADVVAFPSFYEGFGLPILEGQAAKKPVLTGTGGSLAEIGRGSVLAVDVQSSVEIARGLERLVTDQKLRQELIVKGIENLKRFSWAKMAKETVGVLERVVGR